MIDITAISPIGFGTYRVSAHNPDHRAALQYALEQGCNLIDTSSNYQNGQSEELVGKVLAADPGRDVFIITKAGYVGEQDAPRLQAWQQEGRIQYLMALGTHSLYCLDVAFLQDQLLQSLKRLQRHYIDAYLLHNPEYYLRDGSGFESSFETIIKQAFTFLEEQVQKGYIRFYGISSNAFAWPVTHQQYISIHRLLQLAQEVSPDHHFRMVQFPYNLGETGAAQPVIDGESLLSICRRHQITTFGNRPLNVDHAGTPLQLGLQPAAFDGLDAATDNRYWEEVKRTIAARLVELDAGSEPGDFEVVRFLEQNWQTMGNVSAVARIYGDYFAPFLDALYDNDHRQQMPAAGKALLSSWYAVMQKYALQQQYRNTSAFVQEKVKAGLLSTTDPAQLPLQVCRRYLQEGIDHVLMGMRKKTYVDAMKELF